MAGSLQDQLLGAGLIKKQKAKNIQTAKKKAVKQSRANKTELKNEAAELANKAKEEQRRKSQELNKQRKKEAEQKAIMAQINQIISLNSIQKSPANMEDKDLSSYNFTHNNKVKTLYVSPTNHDLVSRGVIAISYLEEGDEYHLIPAEAANKIRERNNDSVVLLNDFASKENESLESENQEDDPYAGYEVPDDLMW